MRQSILGGMFGAVLLMGCGAHSPDWSGWRDAHAVDADAHWIAADVVLLPKGGDADQWGLVSGLSDNARPIPLMPVDGSSHAEAWPHLRDWTAFRVDLSREEMRGLIKSRPMIVEWSGRNVVDVSEVQMAGVLDDLFTSGPNDADEAIDLGAVVTPTGAGFAVWAPTAQSVRVKMFSADLALTEALPMKEDPATGIWRVSAAGAEAAGAYYQYEAELFHPATGRIETVTTTDPYSLSLSADSLYSQIVDLNDPATKPDGWDAQRVQALPFPEANVLYEVHIGDFSGTDESIVNREIRGKYAAFSLRNSDGMGHLRSLREAGLTTIHLLPTYDIGTVPERREDRISLDDPLEKACERLPDAEFCAAVDLTMSVGELLASFDPATENAQAVIEAIDEVDDYNWGYDPVHYTVPEGSYALNPDGMPRLVEFRQMVQRLHEMGFRVVMDVVYNHTYKSGLDELSVLDKIVPGYYHRRHAVTGAIEQSTCCENTATEHAMMAKLMTDSLVVWARDYKIDGFRFDLMGHQPRGAMLRAREAVQSVDPDTYFYGEGWNFGEVADNARFRQASQLELAGTEIGTFSDRLRDAVRGGSSFVDGSDLRRGQGLGNGLVTLPNELAPEDGLITYRLYSDQVRVGLAGNLADFPLTDRFGEDVTGKDIPYGDAPAGYALDPADTITYVSKHDNQTLWDNNQYRIAAEASPMERARMQVQGLSFVLYAQGVPFLHMGSELLRSKSFLRDSYNYGHWFNDVDFSGQRINDAAGLPPAVKDQRNWDMIGRLRRMNEGRDRVGPAEISHAREAVMDMIAVRTGSPLFSLPTAQDIIDRVRFHNSGPDGIAGLIVMSLADDQGLADLDPSVHEIVVIFNHGPDNISVPYTGAGAFRLHPVLASGSDPIMRRAGADASGFTVPGWTTVVFVRPQ